MARAALRVIQHAFPEMGHSSFLSELPSTSSTGTSTSWSWIHEGANGGLQAAAWYQFDHSCIDAGTTKLRELTSTTTAQWSLQTALQ